MTTEPSSFRKVSIAVKLAGGQVDAFHARKTIKRIVGTEHAGLWTRSLLEDSDNNWLIACARRHPAIRNKNSDYCLLLCGGGYDILLILNNAKLPAKLSNVPRVTVSICVATRRDGKFIEEDPIDEYGALCPTDSMMDLIMGEMTPIVDCRVYLDATSSETFGSILGGSLDKKRIIRCHVSENGLLISAKVERIKDQAAALFGTVDEASDWLVVDPIVGDNAAPSDGGAFQNQENVAARDGHASGKFGEAFNPKEFLLLEKAYLGEMTSADLRNDGKHFTKTDIKKAMQLARGMDRAAEGKATDDEREPDSATGSHANEGAKANAAAAGKAGTNGAGLAKKHERPASVKAEADEAATGKPKKRGRDRPKGSKSKAPLDETEDIANDKSQDSTERGKSAAAKQSPIHFEAKPKPDLTARTKKPASDLRTAVDKAEPSTATKPTVDKKGTSVTPSKEKTETSDESAVAGHPIENEKQSSKRKKKSRKRSKGHSATEDLPSSSKKPK